jgi:ligand-binding sensor domain-containing protein
MTAISSPHKLFREYGFAVARVAVAVLAGSIGVVAQPRYQFDHWTIDDGLPQNSVNAILQTRDGYLWLATYDGLVRFDGSHFTVFNKGNTRGGIAGNRFDMLYEDRHGALWALTDDNRLVKYEGGALTTYSSKDGLPLWKVVQIEEDENGDFQVVYRDGIAKWKDGRFVAYPLAELIPSTSARTNWINGNKLAWVSDVGLHWYSHGRVTSYTLDRGLPSLNVHSIWEDQQGTVWFSTDERGLMRAKDGRLSVCLPAERHSGLVVQEDSKGNTWVAGPGRWLDRQYEGRLVRYPSPSSAVVSTPYNFYEDRQGNFWFGASDGLFRAREPTIAVYTRKDGLSMNNIYVIREDRAGAMWFGTWGGGVTRLKGNRRGYLKTVEEGVIGSFITCLYEDHDGYMWIGTVRIQ